MSPNHDVPAAELIEAAGVLDLRNRKLRTLCQLRILVVAGLAIALLAGCAEQKRGGRPGRYRKGGQRVFRGPQQSSTAQPQPVASTTTETPKAPNSESGWHFTVRWMHVENIAGPKDAPSADEYMARSSHKAALVLTADGADPVPAQGWALCFNAGFFMRIDEEEFKKNNPTVKLVATGVVGRYRIEPGAGFQPLAKGQSLTIPYIGKRMVMLESDRPGGFYLVSVVPGELERVLGGVPRRASGTALWIVYDPVKGAPPAPEPIGPRRRQRRGLPVTPASRSLPKHNPLCPFPERSRRTQHTALTSAL